MDRTSKEENRLTDSEIEDVLEAFYKGIEIYDDVQCPPPGTPYMRPGYPAEQYTWLDQIAMWEMKVRADIETMEMLQAYREMRPYELSYRYGMELVVGIKRAWSWNY